MSLLPVNAPFQWQIVRADLDPVEGSEQAGIRPVIIVSRESANKSLSLVVVLPLTSRKSGRIVHVGEILLAAGEGGLPTDSIAMCQQIRTLSKARLLGSYGTLTDEVTRENVRQALRIHLDLD